jgi:hypothetical protein
MEIKGGPQEVGAQAERRLPALPSNIIENPTGVGGGDGEITAPASEGDTPPVRCKGGWVEDDNGEKWLIPPPEGATPAQLEEHRSKWSPQAFGYKPEDV